jgi:hypothetical protein
MSPEVETFSRKFRRNITSHSLTITPLATPAFENTSTIFLLVVVLSAPGNSEKRNIVRKTWGRAENWVLNGKRTPLLKRKFYGVAFIIGNSGTDQLDNENVGKEISKSKDILLGNFTDSYHSLVTKDLMAFSWALTINFTYVMKADDDVYVNVPLVMSWLSNKCSNLPRDLYAGKVHWAETPNRSKKNQNYLSSDLYAKDTLPPYCAGLSYIMSRDLLLRILHVHSSAIINRIQVEDVYIGALVQSLGILPYSHRGFRLRIKVIPSEELTTFTECFLYGTFTYGHSLQNHHMNHMHNVFLKMSFRNNSELAFKCALKKAVFLSHFLPYFICIILGLVTFIFLLRIAIIYGSESVAAIGSCLLNKAGFF